MALGALIIKDLQRFTDEKLVAQIKNNPCSQIFIVLEVYQCSAQFDPSMLVNFRKRLPESVTNNYNKRIVCHALNVIRSAKSVNDQGLGNGSTSLINSDLEGIEADGSEPGLFVD